eukprot:TRINITY_DN6340_c0_g1_i3.p1 TRINITY_DN6340_c0_g1~~TRINITY_DN6340_c0_g1_i3.p1  ORF type:complete len:415 (+),score=60.70 TRINITY_DN6340_c0_g1_i3:267-1511(+)
MLWFAALAASFRICLSQEFSMRKAVRVGHSESVKLEVDGGRTVDVVTISDEATGLPIFQIDDFLSEEECSAIKAFGQDETELIRSGTDGLKGVLWSWDQFSAKEHREFLEHYDENRDGHFDEREIAQLFQNEAAVYAYNHSRLLELEFPQHAGECGSADNSAQQCRSIDKRELALKEMLKVRWPSYLNRLISEHPESVQRVSDTRWVPYHESPVLQKLLKKVAAVTGLPEQTVGRQTDSLQLLRYKSGGMHYSCHKDESVNPEAIMENYNGRFRFMTFFLYLNDVAEGGETVFYGTKMNGTENHFLTFEEAEAIEEKCRLTKYCPTETGGKPGHPFENAAFVRPKRGRAIFWYNADVDAEGVGTRFLFNSIHGSCPTKSEAKWASNVWLYGTQPEMNWHGLEEEDESDQDQERY